MSTYCSYTDHENTIYITYIVLFAVGVVFGAFAALFFFTRAQKQLQLKNFDEALQFMVLGSISLVGVVLWPLGIVMGFVAVYIYLKNKKK